MLSWTIDKTMDKTWIKPSVFPKLEVARKNTKIFSEYRKRAAKINFVITNRYFYYLVNWLLLSSFLVIMFISHTCFLL